MQRLLESEIRTEAFLNVRLMYLVMEYTFSRNHAKTPYLSSTPLTTDRTSKQRSQANNKL